MNRRLLVGILGLWLLSAAPAQASQVSDGIDAVWGWLTTPINAISNFSMHVVGCVGEATVQLIKDVLSNANPGHLVP